MSEDCKYVPGPYLGSHCWHLGEKPTFMFYKQSNRHGEKLPFNEVETGRITALRAYEKCCWCGKERFLRL